MKGFVVYIVTFAGFAIILTDSQTFWYQPPALKLRLYIGDGVFDGVAVFVGVGVCVIGVGDKLTVGVTDGVTEVVGVADGHGPMLDMSKGPLYSSLTKSSAQTYSVNKGTIVPTLIMPVQPVYL